MIKEIWNHLTNWAEGYLWVPVMLASILAAGVAINLLTGHPVKENIDWLIDYQSLSYKCTLIILFTSIFKQATGSWMTKEDKLAHPINHAIGTVATLLSFYGFIYLFSH